MKKILTVLVFFALIFQSCRKEELNGEFSPIVGKWELYMSYSLSGYTNISVDHKSYHRLEFQSNGRVSALDKHEKCIEKGVIQQISVSGNFVYGPGYLVTRYSVDIHQTNLFKKDYILGGIYEILYHDNPSGTIPEEIEIHTHFLNGEDRSSSAFFYKRY